MPTQLTLWFRWLILFKSVLSFWAKCRILYSVSFYASFWPAKLFDCSVSAVMKLSLRSSWETPWELNFCGCRCWDRCLCSLQHSLWVLLCWISPGTCQSTDVLAQPLVPVSGVRAVRCFHRPANLFWPKARIPVFFPLLTELVTWLMLGLLLLVCKEGCRWSYSQKALEWRSSSFIPSVPRDDGRGELHMPGSSCSLTSLLPQPSSLCGHLKLCQQTFPTQVIHFSWQLLTVMFLCLALF